MGSAAVIPLVREVELDDSRLEVFYWNHFFSMPIWMQNNLRAPIQVESRQAVALRLINELGPLARGAIPELVAAYEHDYIRQYSLPSNKTLDWTEQLENPFATGIRGGYVSAYRFDILTYLSRYDTNKDIIPLILTAVREQATAQDDSLPLWFNLPPGEMLQSIEDSRSILIKASTNSCPNVRNASMLMLGLLPPDENGLTSALIAAALDSDRSTSFSAFFALIRAPLDFDAALPVFGRFMVNDDPTIRSFARRAVLVSTGRGRRLFLALKDSLNSPDSAMRLGAMQVLRNFPDQAHENLARIHELTDPVIETNLEIRAEAQLITNLLAKTQTPSP